MSNFVHLHVHSHYSLLDGLGQIPDLIKKAKDLEMPALALTDHGAMYGIIEFFQEAKKAGIQPIIGMETYISPREHTSKSVGIDTKPFHLVLLAKNFDGYKNLMKITSEAHLHGYYYKPRIDKEFLKNHCEGLIALSACLAGEVSRTILSKDDQKAKNVIKQYQEIFGKNNYYLELQHHSQIPEQALVNDKIIQFAKELSVPLVATNDVHYVNSEDAQAHQLLLCVQTGKTIYDSDKMEYNGDFSLLPTDTMLEHFSAVPEVISNTLEIADKCNFEIKFYKDLLPTFPIPKKQDENEFLAKKCFDGAIFRYGKLTPEIETRLRYELDVIKKMGFSSYFLIVADFIQFAKSRGILVGPGRGSAAGSIVAYSLNITNIEPLRYGLLFERFLNPDRISMPDIDMDFADDRRGEVIDYVMEKYGKTHVAGIITFGTMAARAAIRDVGRALGMSYAEVDRIAKLVPPPVQGRHIPLEKSAKEAQDLNEVYETEEQTKKLIDFAIKLEGTVRHASQHACAIVISRESLTEYAPVQMAQKGDVGQITQYSMKPIEDIGLLKMDFLGLSNLTVIQNTLRIIEAIYDKQIDIHNLPLDDKKTFKLFGKGETTGVFQLESSGMKRYIKDLQPTALEDIIAMVSLYRPGPMQWIESFINRKHGREKIVYEHPLMESALKETYGIPVYQEQVMQVAKDMAGFSGGEADTLRKAMGKKIAKLMKQMKEKFIEGSVKNGVNENLAVKIFEQFEEFAAYGFNKSHAACYAMIAYQTAYLKANYPECFMAALLTSDYQNIDRISIEISECERMGISVLPPNVNESFLEFGVVKGTKNIRFGLSAIKNVGVGVSENIVNERKTGGKFSSLADFVNRLSTSVINKKTMEALAKAGAFDELGERKAILEAMEQILKFAQDKARSFKKNQVSLFEGSDTQIDNLIDFKLPNVQPATSKEKLMWEKELLGIYLSDHPLKEYQEKTIKISRTIDAINELPDNASITLYGIISSGKKINTKSGKPMLFLTLEDTKGTVELIVFPKILEESANLWGTDRMVLVCGKISNKDGESKLIVEKGWLVDENTDFKAVTAEIKEVEKRLAKKNYYAKNGNSRFETEEISPIGFKPKYFIVDLAKSTDKKKMLELKNLFGKFEGDTPVIIRVPFNGGFREMPTKTKVDPNPELKRLVEQILSG